MNRDLLKSIDRVVRILLKNGSHVPNGHTVRELHGLLEKINIVSDLPHEVDWDEFGVLREHLHPRAQAGAGGDVIGGRVVKMGAIITRALQSPMPPSLSRFSWLQDDELRDILDRDLEEAESALKFGNLKSCMVLCGSILEAAIYEYLSRDPAWTMKQVGVPRHDDGKPKQIKSRKVEDQWTLEQLVNFSCSHGVIADQLRGVLHGALREPRNLVHPVAELRKGHRVDSETAKLCMAALSQSLKRLSEAKGPPP